MNEYKPVSSQADPSDLQPPVVHSSKVAGKFIFFALFVIAAVLGLFVFWATQSMEPLVIKNAPFPVRTIRQEPTPDGVIILTVDYCKNSDAVGEVRTSFVSSSREIFLPISQEHLPKGCFNHIEVPVIIPKDLTPDTYKIKFHVTYHINPLKTAVIKDFDTHTFTVGHAGDPGTAVVIPQP